MDQQRSSKYSFLSAHQPPVLEIEATEGNYLVASGGMRILDAAGGAIVCNIGHGRREVAEAMAEEVARNTYVVPPFATESRVRLTERLQDKWLPQGLDRILFANGGSEAMDAALRIARQHHVSAGRGGKWKMIGRELSYHGVSLATLAVGGHAKRRAGLEPLLHDWAKAPACYPLRCGLCAGEGACNLACADALADIIEQEGPDSVAAFVVEAMGGSTAGALVPHDGYLLRVAEICKHYDVLLIVDEVMTGFGRSGRRFAVDHWGLVPDLLVSGKGLAGGYAPICGIYAREEVVAPIAVAGDEVMFYTYAAHPGACAAADAVLNILEREKLVERAARMGRLLGERLQTLLDSPYVAAVRGLGLLQAVELVRDRDTLEPFAPEAHFTLRVVGAGTARGVFFYPGGAGPCPDVVCLGPPFTIEEEEIDRIVEVLGQSIEDAASGL